MQGNSGEFAKLNKDMLDYLGAVDLTQYFIQSYEIFDDNKFLNKSTHGNKGVQVDFIFSRRLLNQVLTVFLPTMSIVIVSFCTSLFKVCMLHSSIKMAKDNCSLPTSPVTLRRMCL